MFPVSTEFKRAVRRGHSATIRAEVWRGEVFLRTLRPTDGSVDIDSRRAQRRTCTLTVPAAKPSFDLEAVWNTYLSIKTTAGGPFATYADLNASAATYGDLQEITGYDEVSVDDGLIPTSPFSDVTPFGNEVRIWRGIVVDAPQYPTYASLRTLADYTALNATADTYGELAQSTGTEQVTEEVPLGVFVMTEVDVEDSDDGATMTIVGVDRSKKIADALWVDPVSVPSATVPDAISSVLTDRWFGVETDFPTLAQTVPATVLGLKDTGSGKDPWSDAQKFAEAAARDLYFDGTGVAVLPPVVDPTTATPVETYIENAEAMLLSAKRGLSSDTTRNGIVMTGEGTNVDPPVRGVVFDEDPASPTYRYGPFGERPDFISSPLVLTEADAITAAAAELSKRKGAEEAVEWTQICDPSLDAGDVIKIRNTGTRLDKVVVLDRVSIPLNVSAPMTGVARTVRVLTEAE